MRTDDQTSVESLPTGAVDAPCFSPLTSRSNNPWLSDQESNRLCSALAEWLVEFDADRADLKNGAAVLLPLSLNDLSMYAHRYYLAELVLSVAPKSWKPEAWHEPREEASRTARPMADRFYRNISVALQQSEADCLRSILATTGEFWQRARKKGEIWDVPDFIVRIADQLGALMTFKNAYRAGMESIKEWWGVVAHRTVKRILLTKVLKALEDGRVRRLPDEPSVLPQDLREYAQTESNTNCVIYIMQQALMPFDKLQAPNDTSSKQKGFTYLSLQQSIDYFTNQKSGFVRQVRRELMYARKVDSYDQSDDEDNSDVAACDDAIERITSTFDDGAQRREDLQHRLWTVMQKCLGPEGSRRMWVLSILRLPQERLPDVPCDRQWEDIVEIVLQDSCPEDVEALLLFPWSQALVAFRSLAQRARKNPGRITAAGLRQYYSRSLDKVTSSVGDWESFQRDGWWDEQGEVVEADASVWRLPGAAEPGFKALCQ